MDIYKDNFVKKLKTYNKLKIKYNKLINHTKMSICYYPSYNKSKSLNYKLERFRIINEINLTYYLDKSIIDKIMKRILIDFCESSVIGYDRYHDKYWCKKYNKLICKLNIEIYVIFKGYNYSEIKIIPLVGMNEEINTFIYDFNESIQLYMESDFIRGIIESESL